VAVFYLFAGGELQDAHAFWERRHAELFTVHRVAQYVGFNLTGETEADLLRAEKQAATKVQLGLKYGLQDVTVE
jgi:hypothetical protein